MHKEWVEASEAGAAVGARGGEADPFGVVSDWQVHGDGGSE